MYLVWEYLVIVPPGPTTSQACDDGDPCTINDMETILNSDSSICVPCAGTTVDCSSGSTSVVACDDGDPCTINDMQTILDCDGSICVPCAGTTVDCSSGSTSVVTCDDGDPCTINDVQTILDCDGSICVPCQGTPAPCGTDASCEMQSSCDDGDPCTINDMETILSSDGSVCVPCAGTPIDCSNGPTSTLPCDDGNPDTYDDQETILDCDGTVCSPCAGTPCNIVANIQDPIVPLNCQSLEAGIVLETTGSSTGADIVYEWTFANTLVGNTASLEIFEEGIYSLLVRDSSSGCSATDVIELTIPTIDLNPVFNINGERCPGQNDGSLSIDTVLGGEPPYLFALNSSNYVLDTQFENLSPGVYVLRIQDAGGCESEVEITIPTASPQAIDLGPDQQIELGDSLQLFVTTNLNVDNIFWDFHESLSCADCLSPVVRPFEQTTYTVTVEDTNGCVLSDQITVFINRALNVFIPNGFSPNGDGFNDYFAIFVGPNVKTIRRFSIFNRWGGTLFSASNIVGNDIQLGWDGMYQGKEVDPGVYVYSVEVEFVDGHVEILNGDLTLVK